MVDGHSVMFVDYYMRTIYAKMLHLHVPKPKRRWGDTFSDEIVERQT